MDVITEHLLFMFFSDKMNLLDSFHKVAANVRGLPQGRYFITVSPEPQPIEKLMMKLTSKSQIEFGQAPY